MKSEIVFHIFSMLIFTLFGEPKDGDISETYAVNDLNIYILKLFVSY